MTRTTMAKLLRLARDGRVEPLGMDVRSLGFASFAEAAAASARAWAAQDRRIQEVLAMTLAAPRKRRTRIPPRQRRGV